MINTAGDLEALLSQLTDAHRCSWYPEHDPELGHAILCDGGDGEPDMIGTGDSYTEALADAIATVRGWEQSAGP